jgi:hypothetical protein
MDALTVRHLVATLAYRASKVLRDAPPEFTGMAVAPGLRTPVQIAGHLGDLTAWAVTLARGEYTWAPGGGPDFEVEVERFFAGLAALDAQLAAAEPPPGAIEKLIQGPLADALTHVGQLAMMRRMCGVPVRPESYAKADIVIGRVGRDQSPPGREFDGDASQRR